MNSWYFDGTHGTLLHGGTIIGPPLYLGPRPGVDLEMWRTALRLAGEGRPIPTEYTLLRDARAHVGLAEFRRAVLDAATAAEIALSAVLDRSTASAGSAISRAIRDANKDLGRLSRTLRNVFQVPIPETTQSRLADPRNKAIHAGVAPSRADAKAAVEVAAQIVELSNPLAQLVT